ncbi:MULTISPECIES: aromatic acid/H+ symport family MFS transporter [Saccharopolyspora]|uniref:MFS transporter n=1 Tax=Saccharopolyspora TaxID=1835 RepID=UPI001CD1BD58|nr:MULTISPECIES: aromatic acid/H+ symport family MFS transporter [Saccharopolyspora]MCA1186626.1 aromatic acid/H+ symport family MFS transporter [Saccharopolyspora sp. 6T]MCA1191809.1 aromatic acid/H+ symport family MFS transporter [Saccharopolyspora sp. 6V]MCA1227358.1 aromatic acid/H+ symport family MFS transporter [Saccharopolyspora sp. 6M]MCA1281196.1 aromatic acid/H+ symport family MFS transporter [Saccharopolyspora sp. 7B]
MATGTGAGRVAHAGWVVPLCWSAVLLDGFDLVVLGSVLPVLLDQGQWGLTPATASLASTAGLLGMAIGALGFGTVTDVIGRRTALMVSVAGFSLLTALCAVAPSLLVFGVLRFLAGLGLGGCVPTAIALVTEHARPGRNGAASTTIMTGYHVGAILTAVLGILVLPALGWRSMFLFGAAPALVLVPLMVRYLPESESFRRSATAGAGVRGGLDTVAGLFRGGFARSTLAFWAASFMGLLLVYGLNTWLPEIMRVAGYPLGAALGLLLALNLGAVFGLVVAGFVADRAGIRTVTIGWFLAAAVFLAALSIRLPEAGVYAAVFVAGSFVFSAQVLVYAFIGRAYPAETRATGLGWSAGVGRIGAICGPLLGGALLTAGIAYPWGFYAYAAVGVLGALGIALVRAPGRG